MTIYPSTLGNNVIELGSIGYYPRQADFDILTPQFTGKVVIASLMHLQPHAKEFLIKNGFTPLNKPITNPNSGNQITLFEKVY